MKEDFNSFPFYPDIPFCSTCGAPLRNQTKIINLELELDYQRVIKGRCNKCRHSYNFISKRFLGANGEIYFGRFNANGLTPTTSGTVTTGGKWDMNRIIKGNRAKNFRLNVAVQKEKDKNLSAKGKTSTIHKIKAISHTLD